MKVNGKTYFTIPLLKLSPKTVMNRLLPLTSPQSSWMRSIIYTELNRPARLNRLYPSQIAVIAKNGEEYVGWGLITLYNPKTARYQVYVKPKYRRQGIGTELAKRMERYLKRKKVHKIEVMPRNERESARFFKSLGFDSSFVKLRDLPLY